MKRRLDLKSTHLREELTGTSSRRGACADGFLQPEAAAERLVGLGFRHWMAGCQTGDLSNWERCWNLYSENLGPQRAKAVMDELSRWVQLVSCRTRRRINVEAPDCLRFCNDECLAVSMIAAAQHQTCPAIRACAFALVEDSKIEDVVDQSGQFATMLRACDQVLPARTLTSASLINLRPASAQLN